MYGDLDWHFGTDYEFRPCSKCQAKFWTKNEIEGFCGYGHRTDLTQITELQSKLWRKARDSSKLGVTQTVSSSGPADVEDVELEGQFDFESSPRSREKKPKIIMIEFPHHANDSNPLTIKCGQPIMQEAVTESLCKKQTLPNKEQLTESAESSNHVGIAIAISDAERSVKRKDCRQGSEIVSMRVRARGRAKPVEARFPRHP